MHAKICISGRNIVPLWEVQPCRFIYFVQWLNYLCKDDHKMHICHWECTCTISIDMLSSGHLLSLESGKPVVGHTERGLHFFFFRYKCRAAFSAACIFVFLSSCSQSCYLLRRFLWTLLRPRNHLPWCTVVQVVSTANAFKILVCQLK